MGNKIYRFFSLPKGVADSIRKDNIVLDASTTIDDVLEQRIELQKKFNEVAIKDPTSQQSKVLEEKLELYNLPEPYFSLYKINYLIKEQLLWLSKLESLNDIHEYTKWQTPEFLISLHEKNGEKIPEQDKENIHRVARGNNGYLSLNPFEGMQHYGIVSFCTDYKSPLMWGHYANGHYGVCVAFSINEEMEFTIDKNRVMVGYYKQSDGKPGSIQMWRKINYESEKPDVFSDELVKHYKSEYEKLTLEQPDIKDNPVIDYFTLLLSNFINQKAPCWKSENEIRLFLTGLSEIPLPEFLESKSSRPYLTLSELYFGCNVEEDTQCLIQNSISNGVDMSFYNMNPIAGTYEFTLSPCN